MNRKQFQRSVALLAAAAAFPATAERASASEMGGSPRYRVGMVAYPGMTALDMIGPQYALASIMDCRVSIVAKTMEPIRTDTNVAILPDLTFDECPDQLTVLFVPGGSQGTVAAMNDPKTLAFVRDRGARAEWVTSVCTGSLVLGAAGLLRGYSATSHWLVRDTVLPMLQARPVNQRVVTDRNRMTGAGVSAGIDFGLTLVSKIKDDEYARAVQLMCEYDPHPPFAAGTPRAAGPQLAGMMIDMHRTFTGNAADAARRAAASWTD